MKKVILLLTAALITFAMFSGCNSNPGETGKYPRNIIFDKKTFDAKSKDWKNSGIKEYQFSQIYYQYKLLICRTTVKNGEVTAREFFWEDTQNPENTYNNPVNFDACVTYDPATTTMNETQKEEFEQKPNYIPYEFVEAKDKVPYATIDEVYSTIDGWYKDIVNTDFEEEKYAQVLIDVTYMTDYPIPADFGVNIGTEYWYDDALRTKEYMETTYPEDGPYEIKLEGHPIPCSGWQDQILDFKVLSK